MLILYLNLLNDFCHRHPEAAVRMQHWVDTLYSLNFSDLNDLHRTFRSADYVSPYTVFNVGGNHYRIVAELIYERRSVLVRGVYTHDEYMKWTKQHRKGKGKR
ncbi:type II toxin-antitoxin system HigB family toxin [Massilia sp. MB5]|uniref:type II toxin-antitoxin system HigB family toxin n=1 Tax=unclassified Massilia TaxID=2609279 RepID=UPI00067DE817|nr:MULTISPECIES: type II toxin-antitoxin system HigB family toxin [unclassified Massilia]AKU22379.1 hypothetical protein ACZ75_13800 [Massilia sp. NR 4-1]UMR32838.1 type II toxin-antitoxin system HigB family toxin [Massilia sp. MB5]